MSPDPHSSPQPAVPSSPGPKLVPAGTPPPAGFPWRGLLLTAVLALLAVGGWKLWDTASNRRTASTTATRIVRAATASAAPILRLTGSTSARNALTVTAPLMRGPDSGRALVLLTVAKSGSIVRKGDVIATIDAQSILDHVDDIGSTVIQAEGDIRKRKAEQQVEIENLTQNIRIAKSNLDSASLDAKASAIRSDIDQEQIKLNIEEATAQYQNALKILQVTKDRHAIELKLLEYTRERHARHRDRHKRDAESFTITAPMSGMVVMQSIFRGGDMGQVQEGDQLSPGQPFMKIVDPRTMQLEARMNQVESEGLRLGQTADIHIDAFPGLTLKGKIVSIGAIGVAPGRDQAFNRSIPLRLALLEQDPRIIPDLSGSADVHIAEPARGVLVPLESLHAGSNGFFVLVQDGANVVRKDVSLAVRTNTEAVIKTGLSGGEEVIVN